MAHEIDDKNARKKELDVKNGRPVDAEEDGDEEDETEE